MINIRLTVVLIAAGLILGVTAIAGSGIGNDRVNVTTGDVHIVVPPIVFPPVFVERSKTREA